VSVEDLADNAEALPTPAKQEPKEPAEKKATLKEDIKKIAKEEVAEAEKPAKSDDGDSKLDTKELAKKVKETVDQKAIDSAAKESDNEATAKAKE